LRGWIGLRGCGKKAARQTLEHDIGEKTQELLEHGTISE